MKAKNHVIYSADKDYLERLAEECRVYIGRECKVYDDRLVVFALPRNARRTRKDDQKVDKVERYSKRERNFGYARD